MATTTTAAPVVAEQDYPLVTKAVLFVDDAISFKGDGIIGNANLGFSIAGDPLVVAEREAQFEASLQYFRSKRIAEMRKRRS
jgi:hypothetical protein